MIGQSERSGIEIESEYQLTGHPVLVEQLEKDTKDKGLELGLITFHQRILYWHSSGHSSSRAVGWEKAQNNSKN